MRLPLIDGQGNFGSVARATPRRPCATRNRAWRSRPHALLDDLDKETVDFQPNYDGQEREPTVLCRRSFRTSSSTAPAASPSAWQTNIPPHNLGEVVDACVAYIENPAISIEEIMVHLPGPDFRPAA